MAANQPIRFIAILADKDNIALAKTLAEAITKDKPDVSTFARRVPVALAEVRSGRVVAHVSSRISDLERIAKSASSTAKTYLIKVGEAPVEKMRDASLFAKTAVAKSEGDVSTVAAQVKEELFGKNAAPIVAKPKEQEDARAFGEFEGELSLDALSQAFSTFGKVARCVIARRGVCKVVFDSKEAAEAAIAKKELKVGETKVSILARQPSSAPKKVAKKEGGGRDQIPRVYMKIENVPDGLDSKTLKELYAKFSPEVADFNAAAKHCILRFVNPESVAQILKEKITTASGAELIAKPYFPRGSKSDKTGSNGNSKKQSSSERTPKSNTFKVWIDEADPAKCSPEQLQALFKGFKGFVSLSRARTNESKYTATYDNEAAVNEILKVKDITCGTAKLVVRAPEKTERKQEAGTAAAPRKQRERVSPDVRAIILAPPADVTAEQVRPLVQAISAEATVEKGSRTGDFLLTFPSAAARDAAVGKDIKVGGTSLKIEAPKARASNNTEFGVFLTGAEKSSEKEITDAVKAVVEVVSIKFLRNGAIVGVKSAKDEEKLLAASLKVKDATIKPEMLKKKVAN